MNLYIVFRASRIWADIIDADGAIVGTCEAHVGRWLIKQGAAMDVTLQPKGADR